MTDVDDIIDGVLEHDSARDIARVREYNRQYYLKNRKLKGRQTGDYKGPIGPPRSSSNRAEPAKKFRGATAQQERRQIAAEKIRRAREKAKQLPPEKRNAVEKKLDAAEKKLKKLNRFNPFGDDKKKSSKPKYTTAKDVADKQHKNRAERKKIAKKRAEKALERAKKQKRADVIRKVRNIERRIETAPDRAKKKIGSIPRKAGEAAREQERRRKARVRRQNENLKRLPGKTKKVVEKRAKKAVNDAIDKALGF